MTWIRRVFDPRFRISARTAASLMLGFLCGSARSGDGRWTDFVYGLFGFVLAHGFSPGSQPPGYAFTPVSGERACHPVDALIRLEGSADSGCGEASDVGSGAYKHGYNRAAVGSVLLRAGIEYDLAPILWIRLNEMKDDDHDVLFHFDTVVRHDSTTIGLGNGCGVAARTTGGGVGKWPYRRP